MTNIKQEGSKETAEAAVAKATMEREAATNELEKATKQAMEATGRAFLKEKETSTTTGIPDIVKELTNKLFVTGSNKEEPSQNTLQPPFPHKSPEPGSFPILHPRIHKLSFPTFDDNDDPLKALVWFWIIDETYLD